MNETPCNLVLEKKLSCCVTIAQLTTPSPTKGID